MNDLRQIPGIGKNIEQDLINIGYDSVASLVGQNPEDIYLKDCLYKGSLLDKYLPGSAQPAMQRCHTLYLSNLAQCSYRCLESVLNRSLPFPQ